MANIDPFTLWRDEGYLDKLGAHQRRLISLKRSRLPSMGVSFLSSNQICRLDSIKTVRAVYSAREKI